MSEPITTDELRHLGHFYRDDRLLALADELDDLRGKRIEKDEGMTILEYNQWIIDNHEPMSDAELRGLLKYTPAHTEYINGCLTMLNMLPPERFKQLREDIATGETWSGYGPNEFYAAISALLYATEDIREKVQR